MKNILVTMGAMFLLACGSGPSNLPPELGSQGLGPPTTADAGNVAVPPPIPSATGTADPPPPSTMDAGSDVLAEASAHPPADASAPILDAAIDVAPPEPDAQVAEAGDPPDAGTPTNEAAAPPTITATCTATGQLPSAELWTFSATIKSDDSVGLSALVQNACVGHDTQQLASPDNALPCGSTYAFQFFRQSGRVTIVAGGSLVTTTDVTCQ